MKTVAILLLVLGLLIGASYFARPFTVSFRLFGNVFGFEVFPNGWSLAVAASLLVAALIVFLRIEP